MERRRRRDFLTPHTDVVEVRSHILCASAFPVTSTSCRKDEPISPSDDRFADTNETIVYGTDSTEWRVRLFASGLLYADAVQVSMPAPWRLPTREEAQILKTLTYPSDERFVTCDGFTFGMPSTSVTKAGQKTKYSVLGLWKRKTTIDVTF